MRRFLIAGNWKMHKDVAETSAFIEGLIAADPSPAVDVVIGPPYTSLPAAAMLVTGSTLVSPPRTFTGSRAAPSPERFLQRCWENSAFLGHRRPLRTTDPLR